MQEGVIQNNGTPQDHWVKPPCYVQFIIGGVQPMAIWPATILIHPRVKEFLTARQK